MISEIRIQNFKSIQDLTLKPGRVTVLIGANGSGKSNILEAIAFASSATSGKLDNSLLFSRGIRVTDEFWMRSAFPDNKLGDGVAPNPAIDFSIRGDANELTLEYEVFATTRPEDGSFSRWIVQTLANEDEVEAELRGMGALGLDGAKQLYEALEQERNEAGKEDQAAEEHFRNNVGVLKKLLGDYLAVRKGSALAAKSETIGFADFLIYAPENTVLRTPPREGATLPLGARGEGLLTLLQSFADPKIGPELSMRLASLKSRLRLFGWFEDLLPPDEAAITQARLQLRDRWLAEDRAIFDQRSANEGFLYVLFYFTLMMSWRTPKFFAIDNLDNALNPKLCAVLMKQITELARTYGKQVICTTHNPAVLEGLDLTQDDQRLFVVRRDAEGHTAVRRIHAPQPQPGEEPVPLSDAFMRGLIGGLPNNF